MDMKTLENLDFLACGRLYPDLPAQDAFEGAELCDMTEDVDDCQDCDSSEGETTTTRLYAESRHVFGTTRSSASPNRGTLIRPTKSPTAHRLMHNDGETIIRRSQYVTSSEPVGSMPDFSTILLILGVMIFLATALLVIVRFYMDMPPTSQTSEASPADEFYESVDLKISDGSHQLVSLIDSSNPLSTAVISDAVSLRWPAHLRHLFSLCDPDAADNTRTLIVLAVHFELPDEEGGAPQLSAANCESAVRQLLSEKWQENDREFRRDFVRATLARLANTVLCV